MTSTMAKKIIGIFNSIQNVRDAHLETYIEGLFSYSKFKIGDRVKLIKTVDPLPYGWSSRGHFLIEGAVATVMDLDFNKDGFAYWISFENDSWIKSDGSIHLYKPEDRGRYHFKEADLAFIEN